VTFEDHLHQSSNGRIILYNEHSRRLGEFVHYLPSDIRFEPQQDPNRFGWRDGNAFALDNDMNNKVTVYGADWCGDTVRAKRHLNNRGVAFDFIDIDQDTTGEKKVIEFNKGKRRIPLIEIASDDGGTKALSVPSESELDQALGK
jgi:glutaredoxin